MARIRLDPVTARQFDHPKLHHSSSICGCNTPLQYVGVLKAGHLLDKCKSLTIKCSSREVLCPGIAQMDLAWDLKGKELMRVYFKASKVILMSNVMYSLGVSVALWHSSDGT
jgi:hypothetical protein